ADPSGKGRTARSSTGGSQAHAGRATTGAARETAARGARRWCRTLSLQGSPDFGHCRDAAWRANVLPGWRAIDAGECRIRAAVDADGAGTHGGRKMRQPRIDAHHGGRASEEARQLPEWHA